MPDSVRAILSATLEPVALFTDFDGTLVEIASSPDAVVVPDDLPHRLKRLYSALDGALAVITGRPIADIDGFLSHQDFSIAGSHGAEHRHGSVTGDPDPAHVAGARRIAAGLMQRLDGESGILVEPKPTGVAVHYRAAPTKRGLVERVVREAVADVAGFRVIEGKKVVEARPRGTDKGEAIRGLMTIAPFKGRVPVFVGDDISDEDGFVAVAALGGFGVKIGTGDTAARFSLPDIAAAHAYLDALAARDRPATDAAPVPAQESMVK